MINEIVTRIIVFLLQTFAYDFDEYQRERIADVLSENQPL